MYASVLASTSAPWRIRPGLIPCVMSMICASAAMRFITPWQVPTKSSSSPKSVRKVMNVPFIPVPGSSLSPLASISPTSRTWLRSTQIRADGFDEAVEIVLGRDGDDLEAARLRLHGGLRADRDHRDARAGRGER